jgi:SAM-dependent methyltransferase
MMPDVSATFSGSIPEHYDRYLGPAYFDAFAADLARRLPRHPPGDVLEIACGTGLVTRHVRERLDPSIALTASDLSPAMLAYAAAKLPASGIDWRESDAMNLPFADEAFGALVCGFGLMFVPDKAKAMAEARRMLKRGGTFVFNVWDRIEHVPHGIANARAMDKLFPGEAEMRFPVPYSMHDRTLLRSLLAAAGFADVSIETARLPIGPVSARDLATGAVRGTPRSLLVEKRGVSLDTVVDEVTAQLVKIGGDPYRSYAQAVVVEAS